jgi:uncharacterized protein YgbK (DUF1537 family)
MSEVLQVIADDLTGACDIGAEFLALGGRVVVRDVGRRETDPAVAVSVCNTASRGCDVAVAVARVREAVRDLAPGWRGILVKKIDTALRGHVGAELAAAMARLGVSEAFVLPAIPAVGRTTVGGVQHVGGTPLADTAFARDPLHPIRESSAVAALEHGGWLAARSLSLASIRESRWDPASAAPAAATAPARAVVCDAETDGDIEAALRVILRRPRPLVLAGSIGLGRALASLLGGRTEAAAPGAGQTAEAAGGVLVVLGSIHPASRAQLVAAQRALGLEVVPVPDAAAVAAAAAHAATLIERGAAVALATPDLRVPEPGGLSDRLAAAVAACLRLAPPAGLVLIGGETAQAVLASLGQPRLQVEARPVPLVVYGRLLDGPRPGLRVATKGGSAGDAEMVIRMMRCFDGKGWR